MKRTVSVLLVIAMLLIAMPFVVVSAAPSGQAVASADDFKKMNAVGNYYLTADITISEPYAKSFYGAFDGNGHSITVSGANYVFPRILGTVKNLTVKGNISASANAEVAGVALYAGSETLSSVAVTFENVISEVNITLSGNSEQTSPVGGIVGRMNKGTVSFVNCVNKGKISANNVTAVGGVVGMVNGASAVTFNSCVNEGMISTQKIAKDKGVGGILGYVEATWYGNNAFALTFDGCENKGQLSAGSETHSGLGGMVGCVYNANSSKATTNIKNCVNSGKLVGASTAISLNMGGMIGRAYAVPHLNIESSTNSGELDNRKASSWSGTGGMVGNFMTVSTAWSWSGINASTVTFKYCMNTANVRGQEAGGIMGAGMQLGSENISISFDSCVNAGSVYANDYAGGIFGVAGLHDGRENFGSLSFKSCYNAGFIKGMNSTAGILGYMAGSNADASKKTIFDSCVNTGAIKCTYVGEWPLETFGAGIVAKFDRDITVTGCVNTGAIQGPVAAVNNTVPMAPKSAKAVTASDNFCLEVYYAKEAYATKKSSVAEIAADVTSDILAIDDSVLWSAFDEMDGLRGEDYTKASWDVLVSVCNTGADLLDPEKTPFTKMKQKDINDAAKNMILTKGLLEAYVAN